MQNTPRHLDPNKMRASDLWGKHKGADVFVIGTGTSLAGFDWGRLKDRVAIALNDAIKVPGFKPHYHLFVDAGIFVRYVKLDLPPETRVICRPDARQHFLEHAACQFKDRIYQFDHVHSPLMEPKTESLFCRSTVATAGIHMGWKLGAARTFLLGVDGYKLPDAYYWDGKTKGAEKRAEKALPDGRITQDRHESWRRDMRDLRNAFLAAKIPVGPWPGPGVYNLSQLSTIDAWEKVGLESALGAWGPAALDLTGVQRPDMPVAEFPIFVDSVGAGLHVEGTFVEIGIKHAWSTVSLLHLFERLDRPRRLVSIDPAPRAIRAWKAKVPAATGRSIARLIGVESQRYARWFHEPIAWLFVDGCHCRTCAMDDVETWGRKIVAGGIMVVHDTSDWAAQHQTSLCLRSGRGEPDACNWVVRNSRLLADRFDLVVASELPASSGIRVYRRRP